MEVTRARADAAQILGSGTAIATQADPELPNPSTEKQGKRPGNVIALLNQKGGAGKTTLATHLAGQLALEGSRVTLLDADPQGSALDWAQRRLQGGEDRLYGVFGLARDSLHQEAPQIALQADFVVIDGPPRVASLARSALLAADLVLIPVQPSAYDVWASHEMVQLITEARVFRPQLRAAFVINRRVVGTVIGREARAALADQPFAALETEISQRIVFADSVAAGRLACEVAPQCAAAREIAALAQAVQEILR
ncbi:AAA family ATPase [Acidovorax sp. LjRoot129]|uniref:ParA family partition ATPase n=1 Tax=Acidovorax sp. LjRoot129 TaxID=3342260 RepID=UPI003ECDAB3A